MRQPVELGHTRPLAWRLDQLNRLERLLHQRQPQVLEALKADLGKPPVEALLELRTIRQELHFTRTHLRGWMADRSRPLELLLQPGRAHVIREPLGCVLIIGPWNYPLQLCLHPLVSALAAGNTVVLKPSEHAPATSQLLAEALGAAFAPEVVQVVQGDGATAAALLEERFDHIFFTGGARVGRLVMTAAARHLTPVTLELGGKSPAIVLSDANIAVSARRLAWGKGLNAGQTCVAPDHLLVEGPIKEPLLVAMAAAIRGFYGDRPLDSPDLGQIINQVQFERLEGLLQAARQAGEVRIGGRSDPERRRIEPTVVLCTSPDHPLMQEEIFGPILPVLEIADLEAALALIRKRPKPLALYLFSHDRQAQQRTLASTSSGGVVFNDVILQAGAPALPFGGVGQSGLGSYHGERGFETFSHTRTVLGRPFWGDLPLRYPPYAGSWPLLKRILS